jgi:hypothetical protein
VTAERFWSWRFAAGCVAVVAMGFFVGGVVFLIPGGDSFDRTGVGCASNLSELAASYAGARERGRIDPTLHGSAQILSWLGGDGLQFGRESVLFCPGDGDAAPPETDDERSTFHPADGAVLRAARGLGSYAVRDFERCPIGPASMEKQPILCDRQGANGRTPHHGDAIWIAFAEGDVRKFTSEELGFAAGEPIVVGPDSRCGLLRVFERP